MQRVRSATDTIRALCLASMLAIGGAASLAQEAIPNETVEIVTKAGIPVDLKGRMAWQIAMERECFSPGLIDGKVGHKTKLATTYFQASRGLPKTGLLDLATLAALKPDPEHAITTHTVTTADLEGITPFTEDWNERAQQDRMGYYSPLDGLAEKFHTSMGVMKALNPAVDFDALTAGTELRVPGIIEGIAPKAVGVKVNLGQKLIIPIDSAGKPVGLFHCSIAAKVEKRPSGQTTIICNNPDPDYTFNPASWPEVKNVSRVLMIPPGPRNPVGMCWIGLDLPGYGIHGTPWPELIGKTGSHGCFRMANWDVRRLSKMVKVGQTVTFISESSNTAAAAR